MWQETKNIYHLSQALTAHVLNGFPTRGVIFIGVTGTDGKTTTSSMIYHILHKAGQKVALVSTVAAIIDGETLDTGLHVTTPDAWRIPTYIKQAKKAGAKYIILETTSHALDQNRVFGIPFLIGVLTNITHEHLDYHKTYEKYMDAKFKLLRNAKVAIINRDDISYPVMHEKLRRTMSSLEARISARSKKVVTYGLRANADVNLEVFPFKANLLGDFNKYNCLAAVSVCISLGLDPLAIRAGLEDFTPPIGRTEIVFQKNFTVMIDFAHTPNSIENILLAIKKEMQPKGRVIHVFGSAGRRDASKRWHMGEASGKYADVIILTAEDPRDEKVEDINKQIAEGITDKKEKEQKKTLFEIPERQEAINKAIALAKKDDVIVITGKGHEKSMNLGSGEIPWSDHEAVRIALGTKSYE